MRDGAGARDLVGHAVVERAEHRFGERGARVDVLDAHVGADLDLVSGEETHGEGVAARAHGVVDVRVVELARGRDEGERVHLGAREAALQREVLVAVAAIVGGLVVAADVAAQLGDVLQVDDVDVVECHVEHVVDAQIEHSLGDVQHDVTVADHARRAHQLVLLDPVDDVVAEH